MCKELNNGYEHVSLNTDLENDIYIVLLDNRITARDESRFFENILKFSSQLPVGTGQNRPVFQRFVYICLYIHMIKIEILYVFKF